MHALALVLALLATLVVFQPAQADWFFDFSWTSVDFGVVPQNGEPPSGGGTLSGSGTATLREFTAGSNVGGNFRFTGPGTGPFDGLWGGNLEKISDTVYQGSIDYPSLQFGQVGFREGSGALTLTPSGISVFAAVVGSGPDAGSNFQGIGTRTVATAAEPFSMALLAFGGLAGAAWMKRRTTQR